MDETPVGFERKLEWKMLGIVGEQLLLSAELTHPSASPALWLHNGKRIAEDEHHAISTSDLINELTLKDITYEMAGRYAIQADTSECSTTVEVSFCVF